MASLYQRRNPYGGDTQRCFEACIDASFVSRMRQEKGMVSNDGSALGLGRGFNPYCRLVLLLYLHGFQRNFFLGPVWFRLDLCLLFFFSFFKKITILA